MCESGRHLRQVCLVKGQTPVVTEGDLSSLMSAALEIRVSYTDSRSRIHMDNYAIHTHSKT